MNNEAKARFNAPALTVCCTLVLQFCINVLKEQATNWEKNQKQVYSTLSEVTTSKYKWLNTIMLNSL